MSDQVSVARLGMLASALSGRTLQVAPVGPGESAWTDGATIFVDAGATARRRLGALVAQASLLAAGSLEPNVLRVLKRRPAVTRRYLAVEGHRALAANEDLLPPQVRALIDREIAARSDSPAASLALALSRQEIADPPESFGTIRARSLLVPRIDTSTSAGKGRQRRNHPLAELAEDDDAAAGDAVDIFSSPVGGGGALGKLLTRMLQVVRRLGEGGQPGADAPTHRTRSGIRGGNAAVSTAPASQSDNRADQAEEGQGTRYPEWDVHRRRYRPNWCTVQEERPPVRDVSSPVSFDGYGLRRPLARLGMGPDWFHRQVHGDDVDIDAAIEARVEAVAGCGPDEAVYIERLRRRRDLAVLVLLDVSGSVAEPGAFGKTVHEQQRAAAAALTAALHDLGDRVALYAFHSRGRSAVHMMPVKRFDDGFDTFVVRRLYGLVPGAYSRLGAAIRHGAAVVEGQGGTSRRLLVVLSDGLAYDHGYERVYGAADAHRALAEARQRGTGCVCLTIGAGTDPEELQRIFSSAAHACIPRQEQLSRLVGPLFRTALRSAEVRRPEARRKLSQISVPRYAAPRVGAQEKAKGT